MRKHIADCKVYIVVLYHQGKRTPMESYSEFKDAEARQAAIHSKHTRVGVGIINKQYAIELESEGKLAWGKSL